MQDAFLEAFECLDMGELPTINLGETDIEYTVRIGAYGAPQLEVLLEHYGKPLFSPGGKSFTPIVRDTQVREQFGRAKSLIVQLRGSAASAPEHERKEVTDEIAWAHLYARRATYDLADLCELCTLGLVQALTTSCAERGISTLGQIKTKLRNRMKVAMACDLQEIKLNGPALSSPKGIFDQLIGEALQLFSSSARRNPSKSFSGLRPCKRNARAISRRAIEVLESSGGSSGEEEDEQAGNAPAGGNEAGDDDDEEEEEGALEALFAQVGAFDGTPGWLTIDAMPTFDKAGLGAPDVKIMHIFTTGVLTLFLLVLRSRISLRSDTAVTHFCTQAGRSATSRANGVASRRITRSGTPTRWARLPGTFGHRSFSLPTTAARARGWR
jgi:hypothetical protein